METHATLDAPVTAAELDPVIRDPLPALVVGDAAVTAPAEHEWPGNLFVMLSYAAAVGLGASALGSAGWAMATGDMHLAPWAVGGAVWAVLQWKLAGEVSHFSRWGWYGAMAELALASAAKLWAMAQGNVAGAAFGLCIDVLWMKYFWDRRGQFDVDLDG